MSVLVNLTIVVARACNYVIGNQGQLPWNLPEDLAHFKRVTMGKPIIMGRRTYDSIGRPLPGRRNIVVSRNPDLKIEGVEVVHSLIDAFYLCNGEEACLIGGGQLYQEGIVWAKKAIITELNFPVAGDTFFMPLDTREWSVTDMSPECGVETSYRFVTYERTNAGIIGHLSIARNRQENEYT